MEFNSIFYFLPLVGVDQLSVCTGPELIDRATPLPLHFLFRRRVQIKGKVNKFGDRPVETRLRGGRSLPTRTRTEWPRARPADLAVFTAERAIRM
jgi:hypothetical protein